MKCPHCKTPLRVLESDLSALANAHVRIQCPSCSRDMIAQVRWSKRWQLRPVSRARIAGTAAERARSNASHDFNIAKLLIRYSAIVTAGLVVWQVLNPVHDPSKPHGWSVVTIVTAGAFCAACFALSVRVDMWLATRAWARSLPRPMLDVTTPAPRSVSTV